MDRNLYNEHSNRSTHFSALPPTSRLNTPGRSPFEREADLLVGAHQFPLSARGGQFRYHQPEGCSRALVTLRSAAEMVSGGYSMSIQDLGSVGEFIAALATLATLVYLAIQIRQNTKQVEEGTRAARASAVSTGLQLINSNRLAIYSDQNVASIWARGMEDPHSLEPIEQMRFRLIFSNALDSEFNNFYQTKDSGFSPDAWDAHISTTRRILSTPGGKWFWQNFSNEYTQDFREEVARILSSDA